MDAMEVKKMRTRQMVVMNGLLLTAMITFTVVFSVFEITIPRLLFVLGVLLLSNALLGFFKRRSTKSLLPIIEQVATYEKQKMGEEWIKQRRIGFVFSFLLGGLMFLLSYWGRDSTGLVFQMDVTLTLLMILFMGGMANIALWMHIRKVDHAKSQLDFQGYTWKSNLIAIVGGIAFSFVMMMFIILYVLTTL